MSTWNPYQVIVMQSELKLATVPAAYRRGLSTTVASGGSVTSIDAGRP